MNFEEKLLRLFRELPDYAQLIIFGVLLVLVIGLSVWKILGWVWNRNLKKDLRRTKAKLQEITDERDQLLHRFEALDQVDSHVWTKPDAYQNDRFVPSEKRPTRFLALCNLKGGVGKTTLTLNLGVCLALSGKRVLLVDLDFQGTLSNLALRKELLGHYRESGWTSDQLLTQDGSIDPNPLAFPLQEVAQCKAIIARERLEIKEFEQQSRFFVNAEHEVRFHLQRNFHQPCVFQHYDFVLFDCPPRMSTACINALTCADHVLIPTTLSQMDIEAVPRTLKWLKELHAVVRATFIGAVVTRARMRSGNLVSYEVKQLGSLKQVIGGQQVGEGFVFTAMIPDHPKFLHFSAQRQAIAAGSQEGRGWFDAVRCELERKMRP